MKRRTRRLTAVLLALVLLCGCSPAVAARDRTVYAMDTVMSLRVYAKDEALLDEMETLLTDLEARLSATDPASALSALNRRGEAEDPELAELLRRAAALSDRTGGALDISLLPVSKAWGVTTGTYQIPDPAALAALPAGMDRITLSGDRITLDPGTALDLGALAKGWAADLCRARLEEAGVSGILSLGASIQTVGAKPDGSPWRIGIQDPDDPAATSLILSLTGSRAVVTSGDYQRCFFEDGVRYCHILDPETRSPVQGTLRSVTIVADEGFLADGLSTALFVLGREAGIEFWRASDDFEAVWIEADGTVTVTEGLASAVAEGKVTVVKR